MKPRYVHIGSMNIEQFGRDDDNPDNEFALAEHLEMSGVDVLALQELYATNKISNANVRPKNKFLGAALDLVKDHTGNEWKYEIFRNRSKNDTSQLCGIAWNTRRVKKVGKTFRIGVKNKANEAGLKLNLWDRHPHAVKFKALPGADAEVKLTDFVIVSLHMKSNVGKRKIVTQTRYHEARELIGHLPSIQSEFDEKDVILLGDTNCKDKNEPAIQEFLGGGFDDLNEDDISTYYKGRNAPFDRIFVPSDRKPFLYSRQYILRSASPLAHDRFLSDHYMIKTSIVVRRDDD